MNNLYSRNVILFNLNFHFLIVYNEKLFSFLKKIIQNKKEKTFSSFLCFHLLILQAHSKQVVITKVFL